MDLATYLNLLLPCERRLFRRQLASKAGVSMQTVSNWVCKRQFPRGIHAQIIMELTQRKVTLEDIYGE